ncbi:hypothetical protein ACQY0O_001097 [Thecaphora frezii]
MQTPLPDYYRTLGLSPTASTSDIKEAYKRLSLRTHPDRFPNATPRERQRYTTRFQTLADAYYVLSDSHRRHEYDQLRNERPSSSFGSDLDDTDDFPETENGASASFFDSFFKGAFASEPSEAPSDGNAPSARTSTNQPQANGVFADVFEELLRPEVQRVAPFWKWIGGASGGALGFILANVPGALGGAFLGGQLGRIRDAKGKSVAEVFMGLAAAQRAEVLTRLLQKVLSQQTTPQ